MKFTAKENKVLTEVYRHLNYFQKGNLDASLLILDFPSKVKSLIEKGILKPFDKEFKHILNWYSLTERGKELFKNHVTKDRLSEDINLSIFEGKYVINFNTSLTL